MKKALVVICSWLSVDGFQGIFFKEQSKLFETDFNVYSISFVKLEPRFFFKERRLFYLKEHTNSDGQAILLVYYAYHRWLPGLLKRCSRGLAVNILKRYLVKHGHNKVIIHAHSLFDAGFWAYLLSLKLKCKYLITEHNQLSFRFYSTSKARLAEKVLASSSALCVVSKDKIRQFAANGFFCRFIEVGNLIPTIFKFNRAQNQDTKVFEIVTIGDLNDFKDHVTMLDALKFIDTKIQQEIKFIWIGYGAWGTGNQNPRLSSLLANYHFNNIIIEKYSTLKRNEVLEVLNRANLFLFSSLSEGMPVSVLEALACGLPVVTTNCGGVDEIIKSSNGIICPIKEPNMIGEAVLSIMLNYNNYNRKEISKDILSRYGSSAFKSRMMDVYTKLDD